MRSIIPDRATSSYDVRRVAAALADDGDVTELWPRWAPQLVTALGRIDGRTVGFVANQSQALAGTLDIAASQKGARFVRFCDAFNIPLVTLVDTPGFLPGKDLEWRGMIRHGAELAFAYAEATVPADLRDPAQGVRRRLHRHGLEGPRQRPLLRLAGRRDRGDGGRGRGPDPLPHASAPKSGSALQDEYAEAFLTPYQAAERGFVDAVIDPADTRAGRGRCARAAGDPAGVAARDASTPSGRCSGRGHATSRHVTARRTRRWITTGRDVVFGCRSRYRVVRSHRIRARECPLPGEGALRYDHRFRSPGGDRDLSSRYWIAQTPEKPVPQVVPAGSDEVASQFALVVPSGDRPYWVPATSAGGAPAAV